MFRNSRDIKRRLEKEDGCSSELPAHITSSNILNRLRRSFYHIQKRTWVQVLSAPYINRQNGSVIEGLHAPLRRNCRGCRT